MSGRMNLASTVVLVSIVSASALACIFEESNYDFGGRRTEPTEEVDPEETDQTCPQGGCDQICGTQIGDNIVGETCKCVGGKCKQGCGVGSLCTCSSGKCEQTCEAKTRCTCSGGGCIQRCDSDTSICTCGGGDCQCTGPGCR